MSSLCSKNRVELTAVQAVPVPQHTRSWKPVPYMDSVDFLKETIANELPWGIKSEEYGLNKNGDQMFGVLTLATGDNEQGLAVGFRQSYNKSLSLGIAVGSQVFVCDNLMFHSDGFKIIRKNTVNVWADFRELAEKQIGQAYGHHKKVKIQVENMRAVPISQGRGYELLGRAVGEMVVKPHQAAVAYEDWRTPRHAVFTPRNLWSLYNCVTEGLKKGSPARLMDRHSAAHDFFVAAKSLA